MKIGVCKNPIYDIIDKLSLNQNYPRLYTHFKIDTIIIMTGLQN